MRFYCPNCQMEYDVTPTETVTTKSGRVAYKANCPTCSQDMAEFEPTQEQSMKTEPATSQPTATEPQTPATMTKPENNAPETTIPVDQATAPAEVNPSPESQPEATNDPNGEEALELAQAALDQAASLVPPSAETAPTAAAEAKPVTPKSVLPLTAEPEAAEPMAEETAEDILSTQPTQ